MIKPGANSGSIFPRSEPDDQSGHRQRQIIGAIGSLLPLLLWLIVGMRPLDVIGLDRWQPLRSISAYYYTGAVAVFAGGLITLALYLFSYRGYDNAYGHRDRVAAVIAGGAAVMVAFFPTKAPDGVMPSSWWLASTGAIHYLSAVVLFGSFIFFALFQFPRSSLPQNDLPADKKMRNLIYFACGMGMVGCMVWALVAGFFDAPIFWPEALALEFFAVSWLVKGRADRTAAAVAERTRYYARHPRDLVARTREAIQGKKSGGSGGSG